MKKLILILILVTISGCKNTSENKQSEFIEDSDFEKSMSEQFDYGLKKMNLKPISEVKSKTIRIWKFPGGGAAFEQMIEFNKSTSELIFYSYLLKEYENKSELSGLNFTKIISDKK
jgi:hypothetical protein